MENEKQDGSDLLKSQGRAYTEKGKSLEDASSSAWVFNLIGGAGLLAIVLIWIGVIPLGMELYMKCIFTVVMGALFLFFIFIGIKSMRQMKSLRQETVQEEQATEEIIRWITGTYTLKQLDQLLDNEELSMEQLYFVRTEKIGELICEKFGTLDEKYLDYIIEKVYETYSPQI